MASVQYVCCELVTLKLWNIEELTTSNNCTFTHYYKINLHGRNLSVNDTLNFTKSALATAHMANYTPI